MNFTRLSQKTDAYFFASGGEAEPSPPWQNCRDSPSLSHHHAASVWSRLARQTFRLAPLSSPARRASHGIPPVLECPPRPGGQHLASVSGKRRHHRSPSMDGAAPTIQRHCARRMACASLQSSICRASEHVAPYTRALARVRTILFYVASTRGRFAIFRVSMMTTSAKEARMPIRIQEMLRLSEASP